MAACSGGLKSFRKWFCAVGVFTIVLWVLYHLPYAGCKSWFRVEVQHRGRQLFEGSPVRGLYPRPLPHEERMYSPSWDAMRIRKPKICSASFSTPILNAYAFHLGTALLFHISTVAPRWVTLVKLVSVFAGGEHFTHMGRVTARTPSIESERAKWPK